MTAIRVGNAPCSWGTLEFESAQGQQIDFSTMLDELVETGYAGSELGDWGFMPTNSVDLAHEFRARAIDLTGAFVPVDFKNLSAHGPGEDTARKVASLLADTADLLDSPFRPFLVLADANGADPIRTLNAGRISPDMGLDQVEWNTFADGVNRIAAAVAHHTGLRTVFHHHCAGYVETLDEIGHLLTLTDPQLVGLVFDTGHFAYGAGGCAGLMQALERFANRIDYVHFKDFDPVIGDRARAGNWDYFEAVRQGVFCELGNGCVDFLAVKQWLVKHGYDGFVTVEQDVLPGMGSPKASARRNRDYLRTIGL